MAEEREEDGLIRLGVAANLARQYAADQRDFADYLVAMLESVLSGEVEVVRRGGLFSEKKIHTIKVPLGDYLYTLDVPPRGPLKASRTKVVRGIKLKTDPLPMEEWLALLGEEITAYAHANRQALEVLKRMME